MKFKGVENKANPFSLDHYTDEQKEVFKKRDETKKRAEEFFQSNVRPINGLGDCC